VLDVGNPGVGMYVVKGASGEVAKDGDITRTAKQKVYKSGFFYSVIELLCLKYFG